MLIDIPDLVFEEIATLIFVRVKRESESYSNLQVVDYMLNLGAIIL